jgi:hypothetical protein
VAGGAGSYSVEGGASESGGATKVRPLGAALQPNASRHDAKTKSVTLFIRVLQTALFDPLTHDPPSQANDYLAHMAINVDGNGREGHLPGP